MEMIILYSFCFYIAIIIAIIRKIKDKKDKNKNKNQLNNTKQEVFYRVVPTTLRDFEDLNNKQQKTEKIHHSKYRYYKKKIMTNREIIFFRKLNRVIPRDFIIVPQAHLSSFFGVSSGQFFNAAFSHINQKSVDFIICDIDNFMPILAIELDDKTHNYKSRIERDIEVNAIFRDSSLPLIRVQSINVSDAKLSQVLYSRLYRS